MSSAGAFIVRNRKQAGLTQVELAKLAFTQQSSISRVETDKISPTIREVERLLGAMNRKLILLSGKADA